MFKYKRDNSVMILFLISHICELEAEYKNRLKLILTRHQATKGYNLQLCFVPVLLCQGATERPSSRWFHVPYVLHFLHTLGVGNSLSRFTASLFFLLFAILSLLSPVIYTFYLICAFSSFFRKYQGQLKTYNRQAQQAKWKYVLKDMQPNPAFWRICSQKHEIFTDVWVVQG